MKHSTEVLILIFFSFIFYLNSKGFLKDKTALQNTEIHISNLNINNVEGDIVHMTLFMEVANNFDSDIFLNRVKLNFIANDKVIKKISQNTQALSINSKTSRNVQIPISINKEGAVDYFQKVFYQDENTDLAAEGLITIFSPSLNETLELDYYAPVPVQKENLNKVFAFSQFFSY